MLYGFLIIFSEFIKIQIALLSKALIRMVVKTSKIKALQTAGRRCFYKNEYEDGKRRILRFASFSIGLSALP